MGGCSIFTAGFKHYGSYLIRPFSTTVDWFVWHSPVICPGIFFGCRSYQYFFAGARGKIPAERYQFGCGILYFSGMKIKLPFLSAALLFLTLAGKAQTAESYYNEGVKLKEEKQIKPALEKFRKAIELNPGYSAAHYEMGWCLNDGGDYVSAIISLRKARIGWAHIPKVYFELGYAFQKTDRKDSALAMYRRCLELKPDYSGVFKQMGYMDYDEEDYTGALAQFAKYEANVKTEIKDYLYWYRKGFCMNATKDYTGAMTALNKSAGLKADYLNTWLELGFACTRLKKDADAIYYYEKAIAVDPKSHVGYNGIGEVYRDLKKDYEQSMIWYYKALGVKPNERKALFGIGYCLNAQRKYNEAIPKLEKAIEMENTYTAAYVELGYSFYSTGQYDKAIPMLEKALSLNPKNENARYYAVLVYVKQKNKAAAQKQVNELKALSSRYVDELQRKVDGI